MIKSNSNKKQKIAELVNSEVDNKKQKKARDSKDYEAMLLELVRDEVKGL